jgi:hypothetical protein
LRQNPLQHNKNLFQQRDRRFFCHCEPPHRFATTIRR